MLESRCNHPSLGYFQKSYLTRTKERIGQITNRGSLKGKLEAIRIVRMKAIAVVMMIKQIERTSGDLNLDKKLKYLKM